MEFRVLVAAAYDECGSSIEVAEEYGCCESWVRRLVQRRRKTGSLQPLTPRRPDKRKLDDDDLEQLRTLIAAKPDMTLAELAEAALDGRGGGVEGDGGRWGAVEGQGKRPAGRAA